MFGADGETAATRNLRKRFHCKAIYCLLGRALISFCTANKHLYLKKHLEVWIVGCSKRQLKVASRQ